MVKRKKIITLMLTAVMLCFMAVPQASAVTPRIYMDWRDGMYFEPDDWNPNPQFNPDPKIPPNWPTWLDRVENYEDRQKVADAIKFELYTGYYNSQTKDRWLKLTNTITRAEFATALARALDLGTDGGTVWYANRVDALVKAGIIPNAGGNWNANITRAEMAQWMGRAATKFGADIKVQDVSFPDTSDPDIIAAARAGVIRGYPDGTFGPQKNAQRVEAAIMLINLARGLNNDLPDVEMFKQLAIESGKADQADIKAWVTGQTQDLEMTEAGKYYTPLLKELNINLLKQNRNRKPDMGWAEKSNYRIEAIELHNTIAIIKETTLFQGYDKYGNKIGLNIDSEGLVYMVKRNGRWVSSHAE